MNHSKYLIVAATELEVGPILKVAKLENEEPKIYSSTIGSIQVDILICGVGLPIASYHLTKTLQMHPYKFVINVGIGGAFNKDLKLGSNVHVINEMFADIGILSKDKFSNLFDMNLLTKGEFPFTQNFMHNYTLINNKHIESLPTANGASVNTIFSNHLEKDLRYENLNPHVENMEGAAIFYVCMMERIPFVEVRSISNYVGEIDKNKWNIPLAIENLNDTIQAIFSEIKAN